MTEEQLLQVATFCKANPTDLRSQEFRRRIEEGFLGNVGGFNFPDFRAMSHKDLLNNCLTNPSFTRLDDIAFWSRVQSASLKSEVPAEVVK